MRLTAKWLGWWVVLQTAQVHAQIFFPDSLVSSNQTCNSSIEFYDETSLGCSKCVIANGASSSSNPLLVPENIGSEVPTSCGCAPNAIWTTRANAACTAIWPATCSLETCSACPSSQVPSQDSTQCMACGNSTLGIQKSECKCPNNAVLREKSENGSYLLTKECVICANGTIADSKTSTCVNCPDPTMIIEDTTNTYVCSCPTGYVEIHSTRLSVRKCVPQVYIDLLSAKVSLATASKLSYSSLNSAAEVSLTSALFDDLIAAAAVGCYFYQSDKDSRSCQALANLCVLQHFGPTVPSCAVFDLIQRNGRVSTVNGINSWSATLPLLHYRSPVSTVLQTPLSMKMSFDETLSQGTTDHLEFIIASYYANGTLINFRSLTDELLFCTSGPTSWMRFGVNMLLENSCELASLSSSELTLYELYLVDLSKSEGEDGRYVPVPVRDLNYRDSGGQYLNQNNQPSDDFLSHRFFLYDGVSGVAVGETAPKVVRFAKTVALTVTTQTIDSQLIYVPVLSVAYVDTTTPTPVSLTFRVSYISDTSGFWTFATVFFIVTCVLGGCRVLVQTFNWQRRRNRNDIVANAMCLWLSAFVSYGIANFALICFVVMFVLCGYFFVVYRLQSDTVLMVPEVNVNDIDGVDEYYTFRVLLLLAFCCQLTSVVRRVYHQDQLQLFFVDWEKPRATIMDIDSAKPTHAPISVWRMILVVNEWNKLQTVRKTSLRFTVVVVLFLLYGWDLRSLAIPVPRAQMQYVKSTDFQLNPYLRFANVSIWWLVTWLGQRLWKWMIFERYIDEPREQLFIDLCTMAKVSCFFLDEQYRGFYLHCRSPHPFADGSMKELVDQLKQEEAGLTAGRHLDSTCPNCQAFEVFVTRKWKRKFHTLYGAVRGDSIADGQGASGEGLIQRSFAPKGPQTLPLRAAEIKHHKGEIATEAMVQNAAQLQEFLQAFVENQNDRFRWRFYRAHTWLTRFLDIPPEMSFSKQSFFLPDTESKFAKAALLLGIENELMLLDVLCFCVLDLWIGNHAISAMTTYGLQTLLLAARKHFGSRNIAKSTLVDSRFLI